MNPAAATMLSAAVLLAPGCAQEADQEAEGAEAVSRAAYRALAARHRLESCGAPEISTGAAYEDRRFQELKRLAAEQGSGHAFWRGENDWRAVSGAVEPPPCPGREGPPRMAAYTRRLDALAGAIAEYRE